MVNIPSDREPTHPGSMLLHEFLQPLGITQRELAVAISVPYQRVNEVVRGRRGVTPSTALRLSRCLGTTPEFWMSLQLRWDLYFAQRDEAEQLNGISPLRGIYLRTKWRCCRSEQPAPRCSVSSYTRTQNAIDSCPCPDEPPLCWSKTRSRA